MKFRSFWVDVSCTLVTGTIRTWMWNMAQAKGANHARDKPSYRRRECKHRLCVIRCQIPTGEVIAIFTVQVVREFTNLYGYSLFSSDVEKTLTINEILSNKIL